ncbi:hypothetical protein ANTPLA_LOCUS2144 [Anthophora plagiata]
MKSSASNRASSSKLLLNKLKSRRPPLRTGEDSKRAKRRTEDQVRENSRDEPKSRKGKFYRIFKTCFDLQMRGRRHKDEIVNVQRNRWKRFRTVAERRWRG